VRAIVIGAAGGLVGGIAGGAFAVAVTQLIKEILAVVTRQDDWLLVVLPLIGLAVAVVVLHAIARGHAIQHLEAQDLEPAPVRRLRVWRLFPADLARADLTADVVRNAGHEEEFPWRLAPVRALAIVSTVGLGAPMGTEAPAAHLGAAAGAALGEAAKGRRDLARAAALGGGRPGLPR
jgi:H+/Cl- antiporter ClcA